MAATTASLAYMICRPFRMCCRDFCLLALLSSERSIRDRDSRAAFLPPGEEPSQAAQVVIVIVEIRQTDEVNCSW